MAALTRIPQGGRTKFGGYLTEDEGFPVTVSRGYDYSANRSTVCVGFYDEMATVAPKWDGVGSLYEALAHHASLAGTGVSTRWGEIMKVYDQLKMSAGASVDDVWVMLVAVARVTCRDILYVDIDKREAEAFMQKVRDAPIAEYSVSAYRARIVAASLDGVDVPKSPKTPIPVVRVGKKEFLLLGGLRPS